MKCDFGMPIKLIAFDLDDTLFNATLLVEKARIAGIEMMREFGFPLTVEQALPILQEVVNEFGSNSENHYDFFLEKLKHHPDYRIHNLNENMLVAAGIMGYHREKVKHFKLFKDVRSNIEKLRSKGYMTAIISDGVPKKQYEKILRLKIEKLFDAIIISDEVGIRKPNPLLFRYCLDRCNVQPNEAIYIGDRLDRDIEPVLRLGMYGILIHRGGKWDPNVTKVKSTIRPSFHIHSLTELWKIIESIDKGLVTNPSEAIQKEGGIENG